MATGVAPAPIRSSMLDVFLTCDTEIWCEGWNALDAQFPSAFDRYVYGRTQKGGFGLPFQVKTLNEHGLHGVFFVEPLFATRFGIEPLKEIVGIVRDGAQEVQLHLHTEWADEATTPLLADHATKRQHLRFFSAAEQQVLISAGATLIEQAGGGRPTAFRAGSFGFNRDTLTVLPACGITFDSSYNASFMGPTSGVAPGTLLFDVICSEGVYEYPMSVLRDGMNRLRHAQLGACSMAELELAMWRALERGQNAFVILFHNFELLDPSKTRPDPIVVRRFSQLCRFLADNKDSFRTSGFTNLEPKVAERQPAPLDVSKYATGRRLVEQLVRRLAA